MVKALCALAATALAVGAGWASGGLAPRLTQALTAGGQAAIYKDVLNRPRLAVVEEDRMLANEGWLPVTVTGVGVRSGGMRLHSVSVAGGDGLPVTIPPGEQARMTLRVQVTDCEQVRPEDTRVVVEVDRWWGRSTFSLAPHEEDRWTSALPCDR